jgi:hypothetical protein
VLLLVRSTDNDEGNVMSRDGDVHIAGKEGANVGEKRHDLVGAVVGVVHRTFGSDVRAVLADLDRDGVLVEPELFFASRVLKHRTALLEDLGTESGEGLDALYEE